MRVSNAWIARNQRTQVRGVGLHGETERFDDGQVARQRPGAGDLPDPLVDHGGLSAMMLRIERLEGGRVDPSHGRQIQPLHQEVAALLGGQLPDPVQGLREVLR